MNQTTKDLLIISVGIIILISMFTVALILIQLMWHISYNAQERADFCENNGMRSEINYADEEVYCIQINRGIGEQYKVRGAKGEYYLIK